MFPDDPEDPEKPKNPLEPEAEGEISPEEGETAPELEADPFDEEDVKPIPPSMRPRSRKGASDSPVVRGRERPEHYREFRGNVQVGPLFKSPDDVILSVANVSTEHDPVSKTSAEAITRMKEKMEAAQSEGDEERVNELKGMIEKHEEAIKDMASLDVSGKPSKVGTTEGLKMIKNLTQPTFGVDNHPDCDGEGCDLCNMTGLAPSKVKPVMVRMYRGATNTTEEVFARYVGKVKTKLRHFTEEVGRWMKMATRGIALQKAASAYDPAQHDRYVTAVKAVQELTEMGDELPQERLSELSKAAIFAEPDPHQVKSFGQEDISKLKEMVQIETEEGDVISGKEAVKRLEAEADKIFDTMVEEITEYYSAKANDTSISMSQRTKAQSILAHIPDIVNMKTETWSRSLPSFKEASNIASNVQAAMKEYDSRRAAGSSGDKAAERVQAYRDALKRAISAEGAAASFKQDRFIELVHRLINIDLQAMGLGTRSYVPGSARPPAPDENIRMHMGGDVIGRLSRIPISTKFKAAESGRITVYDAEGKVLRTSDPRDSGGRRPGGGGGGSSRGPTLTPESKSRWIKGMYEHLQESRGIIAAKRFKSIAESAELIEDLSGADVVIFGLKGKGANLNGMAGRVVESTEKYVIVKVNNAKKLQRFFAEASDKVKLRRDQLIVVDIMENRRPHRVIKPQGSPSHGERFSGISGGHDPKWHNLKHNVPTTPSEIDAMLDRFERELDQDIP